MKVLYLEISEKKNSGKDPNKIEVRFSEGKWKMNSLKIKLPKCLNVKRKFVCNMKHNMEQ